MVWEYIPLSRRTAGDTSRVSKSLDEQTRRRIAALTWHITNRDVLDSSIRKFEIESGHLPNPMDNVVIETEYREFFLTSDDSALLDFMEILMNYIFEQGAGSRNERLEIVETTNRILLEGGTLWVLRPSVDEIRKRTSTAGILPKYKPSEHKNFQLELIASSALEAADEIVQGLAQKEPWRAPLEPYNRAWDSFQSEEISSAFLANLYNSLEKVLEKICVELRGWNSSGDTVSKYLDSLHEHGLFEPDPSMYGEWQNIETGLRVGVQKSGRDRVNHETIDRDYALLLLHQTAAFLNFIIQRYEDQYSIN